MRSNKFIVVSILVGLLLILSSIVVFGVGASVTQTGVRISTPSNNSVICCANYTLKATVDSGNATANITWFIAPAGTETWTRLNGTARATTADLGGGTNETANGTDLDADFSTALMKLNGLYDIKAVFNSSANGTEGVFGTNITVYNITIDNRIPTINFTRFENNTPLYANMILKNDTSVHTFALASNGTANGTLGGSGNATVSVIAVLNSSSTANNTIYMTIDRSTNASLWNLTNSANFSGTIDVSTIGDGIYDLAVYLFKNVSSQGTGSRGNSTAIITQYVANVTNITIDAVAPSLTFTKETTASTIDVFGTMKFKCTATDTINGGMSYEIKLTKPSSETVTKTSTGDITAEFKNTDTDEAGAYTVTCTVTEDGYALLSTTTSSLTFDAVHSSGGGTSGGGGGGSSGGSSLGVVSVSEESLSTETSSNLNRIESNAVSNPTSAVVITGSASSTQKINQNRGKAIALQSLSGLSEDDLKEAIHILYVEKVTSTSATILIASEPLKATLSVGTSKKFDLNRDGTNDIEVKLNSVDGSAADLTVTRLSEGADKLTIVPIVAEEAEEAAPSVAEEQPPVTGKPKMNTGLIVTIVIVLVVIVAAALLLRKKKK